jgi:hypothetical protein
MMLLGGRWFSDDADRPISKFLALIRLINPGISKNELLGSFAKFNKNRACVPGRPSLLNVALRKARRSKAQSIQVLPQKIPKDANIAVGRA